MWPSLCSDGGECRSSVLPFSLVVLQCGRRSAATEARRGRPSSPTSGCFNVAVALQRRRPANIIRLLGVWQEASMWPSLCSDGGLPPEATSEKSEPGFNVAVALQRRRLEEVHVKGARDVVA